MGCNKFLVPSPLHKNVDRYRIPYFVEYPQHGAALEPSGGSKSPEASIKW
jgi:hypothetical protein